MVANQLAHARVVGVSRGTKDVIVESAMQVNDVLGASCAAQCLDRVGIS